MDARVHDGEDAPTVRLRWVFTDFPWLELGTECVINNRIWNEDQISDLKVGQFPLDKSNYEQDARWKIAPCLDGQHMCHPEWLGSGEPWPNDLPDTKYDSYWFPRCCPRICHEALGGMEIGGPCGDKIEFVDPTEGGMEIGGETGDKIEFVDPTEGGMEIGGETGDARSYADAAEGGMEIGGETGDARSYADAAEGGMEIGGETGDKIEHVDPTEGGMEIGGECGDVFTGGGPTPGTSCATAYELAYGAPYTPPITITTGQQWWWLNLGGSGFGDWSVQLSDVSGTINITGYSACSEPSPLFSDSGVSSPYCHTVSFPGVGDFFVVITGSGSYKIKYIFGACP